MRGRKRCCFLARNGYHVSAFDLAETGVEKGRALASQHGVYVDFLQQILRICSFAKIMILFYVVECFIF